jgi:lactoylglutathione lyase
MLLHTSLFVSDVDASIDFYRTLVGYELVHVIESDDGPSSHFVGPADAETVGEASLQFKPADGPVDSGDFDHVALAVDDVDAAVDRVDASHVTGEPETVSDLGLRIAFLDDPDGYGIELIETLD